VVNKLSARPSPPSTSSRAHKVAWHIEQPTSSIDYTQGAPGRSPSRRFPMSADLDERSPSLLMVPMHTGRLRRPSKEKPAERHGDQTCLDIWNQDSGRARRARPRIARAAWTPGKPCRGRAPDTDVQPRRVQARSTRTATGTENFTRQFHRLPTGPVMYVFPHLAGTDPVPVPGLRTVVPVFISACSKTPAGRAREDYDGMVAAVAAQPVPASEESEAAAGRRLGTPCGRP